MPNYQGAHAVLCRVGQKFETYISAALCYWSFRTCT